MNSEQPSREQIEARITALLLGELPADEAALLRYTMAQDPALRKLHDELQATLVLVREAEKHPGEPPVEKGAPLKLSAERREKLLAHFKTPRVEAPSDPLFWLKPIRKRWQVVTLVVIAHILVISAILWSAPRYGLLGKKLQKISVAMVEEKQVPAELQSKTRSADNAERKPGETPPTASPPSVAFNALPKQAEKPKVEAPAQAIPKTQIALPQTESTSEVAAQGVTSSEAGKGGAYSQQIVGYANIPANSGASQLALNDRDQKQKAVKLPQGGQAEKQWVVPGQATPATPAFDFTAGKPNDNKQNFGAVGGNINGFAGTSGFGGGIGGGGGGGANTFNGRPGSSPATPLPTGGIPSSTLALNDRGVNRSAGENVPPLQPAPPPPAAAAVPEQPIPGAALDEVAIAKLETKNPERHYTSGSKERGGGLAGNMFYRNLSQETEKEKVTTLSGAPVAGVAPAEMPPPRASIAPAGGTEYTIASGDTLTRIARENGVTLKALEDANPGVEPKKLRPGKNLTIPSSTASTTAARTPGADNVALGLASDSLATGVAKDSDWVGTLEHQPSSGTANHFTSRYAYVATNAVALNGGLQNTFSPGTAAITPDAAKALGLPKGEFPTKAEQEETIAPTLDAEQLKKKQSYDDAQRDLERKKEMHKLLYSKLMAEKVDLSLPENSMVELTDPAEPNHNQTFWQHLTGQYQSTARMKVESDVTDIPGLAANKPTYQGFDPYFVQTTFEVIQSPKVLSNVVAKLDLQNAWANKNGGQKLTESEAVAELKKRLDLHPVKNTKLIEIGVTSDNPNEAANIANAVAQAYKDYRFETRQQLAALDGQFVQQEKDIQLAQAKVESLGKELAPTQTPKAETAPATKTASALPRFTVENYEVLGNSLLPPEVVSQIINDIPDAVGTNVTVNRVSEVAARLRDAYRERGYVAAVVYVPPQRLTNAVVKLQVYEGEQKDQDRPIRKPAPNAPLPQPEILTRENNFSTFSLNVSDVSFKFAEASLQNGKLPDTASIRSEEFIDAFDYRDPEAAEGQPMAFASERARYPFAHNRELLRFAIKTAAAGREQGRALNLVLLLDNSGSMERADRVAIIREALRVLATQLQPQDTVSVVTFSRSARLWADGVSGDKAGETLERVSGITPEGGTNLEEAMRLAFETAHRHYLANGMNRVVLLTDGAANLGNVDPSALKQKVEAQRKQGIALDCFGIGWEDYNDDLLEQLSSNGDGRYAFLNSPEDASKDFAAKLAGALQIAAADVKVQVEFNPQRVISYRQIGYATHQLTKEQFRDNTVAAGQIAAQEAGNALYTIEVNPGGDGPIATVHVRYKVPGTDEYREHSWEVEYTGNAPALEQSSPAMRLAAVASAFSEWLAASPYAQEVTLDELLRYLSGVPEVYGADDRPKQLETMIREAKSLEGK